MLKQPKGSRAENIVGASMSSGQSTSTRKPSRGTGGRGGGRGRGNGGRRGSGSGGVGKGSRLNSGAKRSTSRDIRTHGNSALNNVAEEADSIPSMRDEVSDAGSLSFLHHSFSFFSLPFFACVLV